MDAGHLPKPQRIVTQNGRPRLMQFARGYPVMGLQPLPGLGFLERAEQPGHRSL